MIVTEKQVLEDWDWFLSGRKLLLSKLPPELQKGLKSLLAGNLELKQLVITSAIGTTDQQLSCQRCHTLISSCWKLPTGYYYCNACLTMGRVSQCDWLIYLPEQNQFPIRKTALTWPGRLTADQKTVSQSILTNYQELGNSVQLLWAVTGAGKTEMTFPIIDHFLANGGRVGFVSPRIDVCNELAPRLKQAFAKTNQLVLHGQVHTPYCYSQLVIATTHQLLRFYHTFDLLIVDEVDAFPYANDLMLQRAMVQAVKPTGKRLYLTATPPLQLRQAVSQQQMPLHYLPRRFHGRALPRPQYRIGSIFNQYDQFSRSIMWLLAHLLKVPRRLLIFVPQALALPRYLAAFKYAFPEVPVETVHAKDTLRLEKVADFRAGTGQVLFTTTILERGVTLADIDVIVLNANHINFTAACLVQIAGRADRAAECERGQVFFCSQYLSLAMKSACHQIDHLNRKAGF